METGDSVALSRCRRVGRLWWKRTLADDVHELPDGEIHGNEVLALVHGRNIGARILLADDGNAVGVSAQQAGASSGWQQ